MKYLVWTEDGQKLLFLEYKDELSAYERALNACWALCYDKLQSLADEEKLTAKEWRNELSKLNSWWKEIRQEPSRAEIFYILNEPYAYLKEE